jgi:hypothetical protein
VIFKIYLLFEPWFPPSAPAVLVVVVEPYTVTTVLVIDERPDKVTEAEESSKLENDIPRPLKV